MELRVTKRGTLSWPHEEIAEIIRKAELTENPVSFQFDSRREATLFSYAVHNHRRRNNIGEGIKVLIDKDKFTVTLLKKKIPEIKLLEGIIKNVAD